MTDLYCIESPCDLIQFEQRIRIFNQIVDSADLWSNSFFLPYSEERCSIGIMPYKRFNSFREEYLWGMGRISFGDTSEVIAIILRKIPQEEYISKNLSEIFL